MSKKKVTFLIETLEGGGAERVTSVLANKFSTHFNVSIIILNKKENEYFTKNSVSKIYPKLSQSTVRVYRVLNRIFVVNKELKKLNSDVIVSLAMPGTNLILLPSLIFRKEKVILSERNDPNQYPKSKILRKIRNILYALSEKVVFQTIDAKDYFGDSIQAKGEVIPNPIKTDLPKRYSGVRKKEIVTFCRLDLQKNIPMLIDAFNMFSKDQPEYKLKIYGKGPLEEELKSYVNSLDYIKGKVQFKGYSNDIHREIMEAAIFVLPSNYEGISNSMLEALAIGLPTICTDCPAGGARMFINSYENGLLIPVGDTMALYKAMKILVEDNLLSERISIQATKIKDELSSEKIANRWAEIINAC